MSGELVRLPNPRWGTVKVVAAVFAAVLLLPVLLLALLPMLIMLVPIAVIAIPVIVPVMLSGAIAARWEHEQQRSSALSRATAAIKRAPAVVR